MKNKISNYIKNFSLLIFLSFNYYGIYAANGLSCKSPFTIETGESQEFQFANQQSEMYFAFQAQHDSMLIHILNINQTPYADISAIKVYAIEDCKSLDLFAESADTASYIAGYLPLLGLSVGNNYLIKIERDANGSLPSAYFDLLFAAHYTYPCPNPAPENCSDLIINGDFSNTTKQNPTGTNSVLLNEVCGNWESYLASWPSVYVYRGQHHHNNGALNNNPFISLHSYVGNSPTEPDGFSIIGNKVDIISGKNYSLSFKLRKGISTPNLGPNYFKVWFIKNSELVNYAPYSTLSSHLMNLTANRQEVASVVPSQTTSGSFTTFDFCINANDDYDRVIFFGYHGVPYVYPPIMSWTDIDDISIVTLDAGDDVSESLCEPKTIGPDCTIPGASYQWSPTTGLDFPNSANPIASPTSTTTYTLTMNLPNGCSVSDQVVVSPELSITIPTGTNIYSLMNLIGTSNYTVSSYFSNVTNSNQNYIEISDKSIKVEGVFNINYNLVLKNCKIYMDENARMNVTKEFKFIGNNERFIKSCDPNKFWDGIYVNGANGGSLEINTLSGGTGENTLIKNAMNGIVGENDPYMNLSYINFDRNNLAIQTTPHNWPTRSISIEYCDFKSTTPLVDNLSNQYYPARAIQIMRYENEDNFPSPHMFISNNDFDGSGGQVYLENSTAIIEQNKFSGFYNSQYSSGINKTETALVIYGNDANTNTHNAYQTIHVKDNTFLSNKLSVFLEDDINYNIDGNIVNYNSADQTYSNRIENSTFLSVSNNMMANLDVHYSEVMNNSIYNVTKGIQLINSESFSIYDNTIDLEKQPNSSYYTLKTNSNGVGILINNMGIQSLTHSFYQMTMRDNLIKHAKYGIISNFSFAEIRDNTIEELNDDLTTTNPAYGIKVLGGSPTIIGNNVNLDVLKYQTTNPTNNMQVSGIFVENSTKTVTYNREWTTEVSCNNVKNTGTGMQFAGNNTDDIIVTYNKMNNHQVGFVLSNNGYLGDVGSIYNGAATTGSSQNEWNGVYNGGFPTYSINSNGASTTLFVGSAVGNTNPVIFSTHKNNLTSTAINKNTVSNTAIVKGCINPYRIVTPKNPIANWSKSGGNTNGASRIANGKTPFMVWVPDSAEIFNKQLLYYTLSQDSLALQSKAWKPFLDSMKNTPMGFSLGLNSSRSAVSLSNFDANSMAINPLLAKFEADSALSKADLYAVQQLANQCPYYDGIAVYQARYILDGLGETYHFNTCEVNAPLPAIAKSSGKLNGDSDNASEISTNFKLYPNPANDIINLEYQVVENEVVTFELIDVLGKVQLSTHLNQINFHEIKLSELQQGIYFYRLISNATLAQSGKLIVD